MNVALSLGTNPNRNRRRRRRNVICFLLRDAMNIEYQFRDPKKTWYVQRSNEIYERHLRLRSGFRNQTRLSIPYRAKRGLYWWRRYPAFGEFDFLSKDGPINPEELPDLFLSIYPPRSSIVDGWTDPVRLFPVPLFILPHSTSIQGIKFWVLCLWRCRFNYARWCLPGRIGQLIQIPKLCHCSCNKLVQVRQRTSWTRSSEWRCSCSSCWMRQSHVRNGYTNTSTAQQIFVWSSIHWEYSSNHNTARVLLMPGNTPVLQRVGRSWRKWGIKGNSDTPVDKGTWLLRRCFKKILAVDLKEEAIWYYKEAFLCCRKLHFVEAILGLCSSLYQRFQLLGLRDDLKKFLDHLYAQHNLDFELLTHVKAQQLHRFQLRTQQLPIPNWVIKW